ncbi:MAG: InlB B-repeat-containing protein, partial [Paludibacteraceae bacterium]|nr:InlB B-repeat-containing protein [Paludibacteraceae bacterium]
AEVTPARKSYEGFEAPAAQTVTILADGSLVVTYNYTRKSYALSWVTDGDALTGSYTTGSTKYGAAIIAPNTPTKTGYDFAGWSNGTSVVIPVATMPAADTEYTATWTPVNYTITFDSNGGTEVASITQGYETSVTPPANPTRTGYTFANWSPEVPSTMPLDGTTCVAQWTLQNYTISYNLDGGNVTSANPTEYTIESEAITLNNPTKSGYTFDGWTGTGLSGATATVTIAAGSTGDRSYTATWHIASSDVLEVGETHEKQITINSNESVTTTIVHADGKLNIEYGKTLTTTELILQASESTSGEIIRGKNASGEFAGGIDVPSNAYFDLTHTGGFKARTWYAVAVPWEVLVPAYQVNGVYLKIGDEYVQQRLGETYDLIFYDGKHRATTGENKAWTYVEDYYAAHTEKEYPVMEPGVAYMIYLTSDADVIRFKKRTNAPVHTTGLQVTEHDSPIKADKHWNGIANPATYHARIDLSSVKVYFGQVYSDPIKQLYSVFDLSEKLVVGQPVFVQVPSTSSVEVSAPSLARRRAKEQVSITRYDLMLAASDADVTDRVIVRMDEEKTENEYVIGQDLVKMGVSDKAPQMWINRYGEKMCVNTVAGYANTADYPLGIFAPKNGEYDLFIDDQPNDETMLYLTYDGEAIWNLSYGGYVASLEKGTNTHYGLRIVKKAPQITTGIEETTVQNGEAVRKVLVNDKVYIIRNGEIYSVTGQKAK